MKTVIFLIFAGVLFAGISALHFSELFEVEYILNVFKTTMVHRQCANQNLDPVSTNTYFSYVENLKRSCNIYIDTIGICAIFLLCQI